MKPGARWLLVAIIGLLLLVGPSILRYLQANPPPAVYAPPAIPTAAVAATPIPTATPVSLVAPPTAATTAAIRRGPVIVDLAHYARVERNRFQPLAAALATQGIDLRFWLPTVSADVESLAAFPDQSDALQATLADATALVVISPFFLYSDKEVQVVTRFLADGGRLLLISDPDIEGDAARDTNSLAARFDVIFNEDYLYDTVDNDENFTHFFQGGFFDQAANLAGSRIAFYGGRSIDGAVTPQVRSAATTLSSLRTGQSGFTTVAIGGLAANNSVGRVLALSDFDALTDPYVARHDNRKLLDFVANFLAGGARNQTIADFPAFLGKDVALIIDSSDPVGAEAVSKAAELQRVLEASGRTLRLGATSWLTDSTAAGAADLLYVAYFEDADRATTLLADAGFTLETRLITPTLPASAALPATESTPAAPTPSAAPGEMTAPATATPTPLPELPALPPAPDVPPTFLPESTPLTLTRAPDGVAQQNPAPTPTQSPVATATPAPETPTESTSAPDSEPALAAPDTIATSDTTRSATPAPTPTTQVYLVRADGIQLLADETLLFLQRTATDGRKTDGRKTVAVLGADADALSAGLARLMSRDLSNCLIQDDLVICPYATHTSRAATQPTSTPSADVSLPDRDAKATPQSESDALILIVDDDRNAVAGDVGEAELYAALLVRAGHTPTLWSTQQNGYPEQDVLRNFTWIIWSDAAYGKSGVTGDALRIVGELINDGGKVMLSSRMPFFGVSADPASPIADVVVADGLPALVAGLPETPITLPGDLPDVTPLERNPDPSTGAAIALRRGPQSAAADAPVLMLYTDENFNEPKGAKLLIFGMSINWLPDDVAAQLVKNMATVMLAE
ncbi:MAG TPA: hypothetical protein DCL15_01040 [Chloroflexi bacterium]|nr:hypothetical protein [Chloroflexota bacterium]HHW85452.1 hypothetical protein [Chloroflexota bacterium]